MREFKDYIIDIFTETCNISKFLKNISYDEFVGNIEKFYAVTRSMEIMGEAAKKVPKEIREKYPEIEWSKLAKLRDKLIHYYYNADEGIIWRTAVKDIALLHKQLIKIIDEI